MKNTPDETAPLRGITVLEVANYVAAPSAGGLMADLGADVIKIEPPGGEVVRGVLPGQPINYLFELENRGKRSVAIALDRPGGVDLLHELMAHADVLLTNFTGPRLRKYRLTARDALATNPRIVHVSVSGYGVEGPDGDRPAFDFAAFWARSGIMSLVGHPDTPPVLSRVAQGDHTTGINGLAATLAALRVRDATGRGQSVEISLQRTGLYTIATDVSRTLMTGVQPAKFDRTAPPNPLWNTYQAGDGRWIMLVHMTPDPYWASLCAAIGRPDLGADPSLATMGGRSERCEELFEIIQGAIGSRPFDHWSKTLDEQGLIWAPMAELPEVIADPQLRATKAFATLQHAAGPFETVATPFVIHDADVGPRGPAPEAGADTFDVLQECGFDADRISDLAATGILG